MSDPRLLTQVWREPAIVREFGNPDWEALLVLAGRARLIATMSYRIERCGLREAVPDKVWNHFQASRVFADFRNRRILWEMNRLQRVLRQVDFEVIALKGGAYLLLDLPLAKGRLPADLDVLVRREHLSTLEDLLLNEGWQDVKLNDYDQRYYREWMHEIPPLRHPQRGVEVDVHHALLPMTARLHADIELLWTSARDVETSQFKVLAPEDMILHAVVHLFYDSDFDNRLRDLIDIDEMLRFFSAREGNFWESLIRRAEVHGLEKPLTCALHSTSRILGTPVPSNLSWQAVKPWSVQGMGFLVGRALLPEDPESFNGIDAMVRWLLYVRSHYLRMPLRLLLPHLLYKALSTPDAKSS